MRNERARKTDNRYQKQHADRQRRDDGDNLDDLDRSRLTFGRTSSDYQNENGFDYDQNADADQNINQSGSSFLYTRLYPLQVHEIFFGDTDAVHDENHA